MAKTYGGVVDEIDENGMNEVCIPLVDEKIQKRIGQKTQEAFELREQGNLIERGTVQTLEELLETPRTKDKLDVYNETFELIGNSELEATMGMADEKRGNLRSWETLRKETGLDAA